MERKAHLETEMETDSLTVADTRQSLGGRYRAQHRDWKRNPRSAERTETEAKRNTHREEGEERAGQWPGRGSEAQGEDRDPQAGERTREWSSEIQRREGKLTQRERNRDPDRGGPAWGGGWRPEGGDRDQRGGGRDQREGHRPRERGMERLRERETETQSMGREGTDTVAQLLFFANSPVLPHQRLGVTQSPSGRGRDMLGA